MQVRRRGEGEGVTIRHELLDNVLLGEVVADTVETDCAPDRVELHLSIDEIIGSR